MFFIQVALALVLYSFYCCSYLGYKEKRYAVTKIRGVLLLR